ncbi:tetratricopeptide repeat protein [Enterovibrio baiacu]|uniref:tetratricopeptide repeat protein n=1 Tax=Enterovibrio baiacu TaxID=2491023 RepID=UPI001011C815|nr:tetratricopeptide repeat protein [Enterovibrio baiacu]MBE1273599.1 hypothetical protein [Enterovibrio baiacu]
MISTKWLELYRYINTQVDTLPAERLFLEQLNDKLMFISAQFLEKGKQPSTKQKDWLENEAFTLVFSDIIPTVKLTSAQLSFLFETLMAAQLCQLAMATINEHKPLLAEDDFKSKCGLVYQQLGDYDLAKATFEEAIALNDANPMTHCHLGFNFLYQGHTELAIECFKYSIEVGPEFVGGYQNLAGVYYQDGDFAQAAEFAERAFSKCTSLVSTYITAISSYLALGDKANAEAWINRAFEHNVTSMELVRLAGISAHQNGRCEEALEALDHYLSHNPNSFDVLNIRAHVKAELGHFGDLEADLKQLLVFEPHDEWSLEHLFLCYYHNEQWADAQAVMVQLNKLAARYKITYREQLNTINKKLSLDLIDLS